MRKKIEFLSAQQDLRYALQILLIIVLRDIDKILNKELYN